MLVSDKKSLLRTSLASPLVKQEYIDLTKKNNFRNTIGKPMDKIDEATGKAQNLPKSMLTSHYFSYQAIYIQSCDETINLPKQR